MAQTFELTAEIRADKGKGASRRLRRREDKIPAIMYGGGEAPATLALDHNEVIHALKHEAFYSHILTIQVAGKKQKAVLRDLQRHPFKPRILHMDFLRVTGKEKITMQVPLHFLNGDKAPGVVDAGGVVTHQLTSLDIRCLPDDLPEYIEVDLANLQLDETVHLSTIKLPKGVESMDLIHGDDPVVASLHIPRAVIEEIPEGAPEVPEAPEAIRQTGEGEEEAGSEEK